MTFHSSRFVPVVVAVLSIAMFAQTKPTPTASPTSAAASATAATAPATPARIGIVDIQTAIVGTNEGQRDFEALRKKFEPKSNELEVLKREVDDLKKKLSTTGDKLNDDARGSLLKQIDNKQKSLQRNFEEANTDFQAEQNEILTRISQKMREVLWKYAQEHGYSIILEANSVLWRTDAVDLTPVLVEAYNSVSGVPPQPKMGGPGAAGTGAPTTNPRPAGGTTTAPK